LVAEALDALPLWAVLVVTTTVVLGAIELGFRIGQWRTASREFESEAQLSAMTGANLALLAFIMAFCFSQAATHHSTRKHLILEEANAVGTAHLRAGLVNKPEGDQIQQLLEDYMVVRVTVAGAIQRGKYAVEFNPGKMIADSLELQAAIWGQIEKLSKYDDVDEMDAILVEAINAVFDIHEKRVAAGMRNRIPINVWVALLGLLTLSMLGIGHFSGMKGKRNPIASSTLALSFSLVVLLIADLDRPTSGLVVADQSAILELNERLSRTRD
jgi:hypothetical protein